MRFQNSTLIVTGGASGIGRATIERALAEGAAVLAVDRDADALPPSKRIQGSALEVLSGDVADADLAAKGRGDRARHGIGAERCRHGGGDF